jgi:hypothetical protein
MRILVAALLSLATLASAKWSDRSASHGIVQELGAKLSPEAAITLEGDDTFGEKTKRWQAWASPQFSAVVEVRSETDVQETVRTLQSTP